MLARLRWWLRVHRCATYRAPDPRVRVAVGLAPSLGLVIVTLQTCCLARPVKVDEGVWRRRTIRALLDAETRALVEATDAEHAGGRRHVLDLAAIKGGDGAS